MFDLMAVAFLLFFFWLGYSHGLLNQLVRVFSDLLAALFSFVINEIKQESGADFPYAVDVGFIIVSFLLLFFSFRFAVHKWMKDKYDRDIPIWDKIPGGMFNAIRSVLLIVIFYQLLLAIVPREDLPKGITEAKASRYIEATAQFLISLLPDTPQRG